MIKKTLYMVLLIVILPLLASCHFFRVYRPDIQQGNVITDHQRKLIHAGMSKAQVIKVLGNPVLTNVNDSNRLYYIYSYQPAYSKLTRQYLIISFRNNKVTNIETNMGIPSYTMTKHQQIKSHELSLPKPKK